MERLTERHKYNRKDYISVDSKKYGISCSNFCTNCGKADCDDIRKALFKLSEYEDLEEQGKLLKLPCAVGDTVYRINKEAKEPIIPMKVCEVGTISLKAGGFVMQIMCRDELDNGEIHYLSTDFGKTVFLTKSAAEVALQKLKETEG